MNLETKNGYGRKKTSPFPEFQEPKDSTRTRNRISILGTSLLLAPPRFLFSIELAVRSPLPSEGKMHLLELTEVVRRAYLELVFALGSGDADVDIRIGRVHEGAIR